MQSYLLEHAASLRVSAFLLVLAVMTVWDRLFASYVPEPAGGQAALRIGFPGFTGPTVSTTFLGVLGIPFRAVRAHQASR